MQNVCDQKTASVGSIKRGGVRRRHRGARCTEWLGLPGEVRMPQSTPWSCVRCRGRALVLRECFCWRFDMHGVPRTCSKRLQELVGDQNPSENQAQLRTSEHENSLLAKSLYLTAFSLVKGRW